MANEFNETRRESCNLSWCALVHDLPKGISDNPVIVPAGRHVTESALQVKTPRPPRRSLLTSLGILSASRSSALSLIGSSASDSGSGPWHLALGLGLGLGGQCRTLASMREFRTVLDQQCLAGLELQPLPLELIHRRLDRFSNRLGLHQAANLQSAFH